MTIPVWHDDQQGSATVILAGLLNALKLVGKDLNRIGIAMIGMGAANVATYRLLKAAGIDPARIVACDRQGILHKGRTDIEAGKTDYVDKWKVCLETNAEGVKGGIPEALKGRDVCIAFSGGNILKAPWLSAMAENSIVFACANPIPEIWPWEAKEAGAKIMATGRSDFPNQVNNSLVFPGVFRGALDIRARTITDDMAIAAAHELADYARERGIHEDSILPTMDEWDVYPRVAVATALQAQEEGIATLKKSREQLHEEATHMITQARDATQLLMKEQIIPPPPIDM
jgi:malate dehydrogenase (oxaloacetate-decarboxylating)